MLSFFLPLWEQSLISEDLDSLLIVQEKWHCQSYFCTETLIGCETCPWQPCQQSLGRRSTAAYGPISLKRGFGSALTVKGHFGHLKKL